MADLISDIVKDFLYERQEDKHGRLDGTLYFCKGHINIRKNTKIDKSIFPTYIIMERHRSPDNRIFYKTFVNIHDSGNEFIAPTESYNILKIKRNDNNKCFFTGPLGALHLYTSILQNIPNHEFTFILDSNSDGTHVTHLNNFNYMEVEAHLQITIQNILQQFQYTDFMSSQRYKPI
jgi:hypothetical protein